MARKKKADERSEGKKSFDQDLFDKEAVEELACAFEFMSSGQAQRLDVFLEERGITEEKFDGYLKSIGKVLGRDMGIL